VPTSQGEVPVLRGGSYRQPAHMDWQVCKGYRGTHFEKNIAIRLPDVNFGSSTSEKQILTSGFILSVI